jgi:hypothetical protein
MESELINYHQYEKLLKKSIIGQLLILVAIVVSALGFIVQDYIFGFYGGTSFYILSWMGPIICALNGRKRLKTKNYLPKMELYLLCDILGSIFFVGGLFPIYGFNIYYCALILPSIIPFVLGYYLSIRSEFLLIKLRNEKEKRNLDQKQIEFKTQYENKMIELREILKESTSFNTSRGRGNLWISYSELWFHGWIKDKARRNCYRFYRECRDIY